MALSDHINFMGSNPLRGPVAKGRERFVDMTGVYDDGLRARMLRAGKRLGMKIPEGIYLAVSGPSFETPAEIRAFRTLGADAVGMSTVPEAIVAMLACARQMTISPAPASPRLASSPITCRAATGPG